MKTNKIICGNHLDVLTSFPDDVIDLTVTSPPYDNLRDYKGYTFNFESLAKELFRITKVGGVVVWVVGDATINGSETGTSFKQALHFKEIGFNLHDTMIYAKKNAVPLTHNRYEQQFEYMFIFSKRRLKTFNLIMLPCKTSGNINYHSLEKCYEPSYSMKTRQEGVIVSDKKIKGNIWLMATGTGYKCEHNAPFPEKLAHDHIISWSNPGDLILDPMCGSGTTCFAADQLKRKYIGIDISEEYCKLARKRIDVVGEHSKAVDLAEQLSSADILI